MDVFIAIVAGLSFRLFLNNIDGPLTPALLGLCEGALVHYLPSRTSSLDHYLAYGLRIILDLFFTENVSRMILVLLWTALSVVASDALESASHHGRKRSRRYTVERTATAHTSRPQRLTTSPPFNPPLTRTPLRQPPYDLNPTPVTPLQHPNRPPSPPSYFLEGESETNISPPSDHQLEYAPQPDSPSNSSSPIIPLPTPPPTLIADVQESDTMSLHRLSTIQELSGDENGNLDKTDTWIEPDHALPLGDIVFDKANAECAPSVANSAPLPVPNATYILTNWTRASVFDNNNPDSSHSPPASISTPLPIPNAAIRLQQSERKPDSASEPDELRTPVAHHWELTDQDELRTPGEPQKELSPLVSDQPLPVGFGVTEEVQPTADESAPLPILVTDPGINNVPSSGITVISTLLNSSVECFPKAVNDQSPDPDKLSEAETLQTETDATSVMSPGNSTQLFSRGEYFRREAIRQDRRMAALKSELTAALKDVRIRDSLFLREEIRVLEEQVKKLHEKAAKRFFKARNSSSSSRKLDVHGLRVPEAIKLTEKALRDAITKGYPDIKVIVGKGLHSVDGIPVLKHAIIHEMQICKIPCRVDPFNTGVLIISIPP